MVKDIQKERFIVNEISHIQKRKRKEIVLVVFGIVFGIFNFLLASIAALSPFMVDLSMAANIVLIIMIPIMVLNFYRLIRFSLILIRRYYGEKRLIELLERMRYNDDYSYERVLEVMGE